MDRALQRSSCYRLDLSTINNQSMQTPELALDACLPLYAWLSELASAFADMISLRYVCVCVLPFVGLSHAGRRSMLRPISHAPSFTNESVS